MEPISSCHMSNQQGKLEIVSDYPLGGEFHA